MPYSGFPMSSTKLAPLHISLARKMCPELSCSFSFFPWFNLEFHEHWPQLCLSPAFSVETEQLFSLYCLVTVSYPLCRAAMYGWAGCALHNGTPQLRACHTHCKHDRFVYFLRQVSKSRSNVSCPNKIRISCSSPESKNKVPQERGTFF